MSKAEKTFRAVKILCMVGTRLCTQFFEAHRMYRTKNET